MVFSLRIVAESVPCQVALASPIAQNVESRAIFNRPGGVACPLSSVRPEWASVGFGAGAGFSVFGGGLVAEAGVPSDGVVFAVPVGQLDARVQDRGEGADVQELIPLT